MKRPGRRWTSASVLAGMATYLAARTFVLREAGATPVLLGGDQGFFWMYGERMLRGEVPYRDFFQFTPPGADVVHLVAFTVLGTRMWVASALVVALGMGLGAACFRIARGILPEPEAALATALFVVLVFGQALTTTHHSWSALAILWALVLLGAGPALAGRGRFAGAGALLGLATFCTQSHGLAALVAFAVFAVWQAPAGRRAEPVAMLLSGFLVTLLASGAYFIATAGIGALASCLVSYVLHHMVRDVPGRDLGLPEALTWRSLPSLTPYLLVYVLVPAGYALVLGRGRGYLAERPPGSPADAVAAVAIERPEPAGKPRSLRDRVVLLWLVGVALLVEVCASFSWVRLFAIAAPGMVLFVWAADREGWLAGVRRVAAWIALAVLTAILVRSTYRNHSVVVDLPGGRVATDAPRAEKLLWLTRHDPPGGLLFAVNRPSVYLPLQLRSPLYLDAAIPNPQTTLEQGRRAAEELDASGVNLVLWSALLESASHEKGCQGVAALGTYLHGHFHRVQSFADGDEAWERP
jgi:hypothetical protein